MTKLFKFLYLNTYSFLLLFLGMIILGLPLYKITVFLCIPQILISILTFENSFRLFSTWDDKKRKYWILLEKNKVVFKPCSFKLFMQQPCGRLLTKCVLKDLDKKQEYSSLLIYRESLFITCKNNFNPIKTKIFINEDY